MKDCSNCRYAPLSGFMEPCFSCVAVNVDMKHTHWEAPTNADRIRAMSDKELAEWLAGTEAKCYRRLEPDIICETESFKEDWLIWLRQEASNDE